LGLWISLALQGQGASVPLLTGRCRADLPLDAGQSFDHQRFLVLKDNTYMFDPDWKAPALRWRLRPTIADPATGNAAGPFRIRKKWRDGALWMMRGSQIFRWDPALRQWILKASPTLEFMDFEVDMTGRVLLVCTADPRTRTYRALLESAESGGSGGAILAPYPDPGSLAWGGRLPPVAAASLQVGYEAVQILEFTLLFNPLSRRLFIFRALEDRIKEVDLGLGHRTYEDLLHPGPLDDLCWQVLPKDASEAWVVVSRQEGQVPGTLNAIPLDLFEGTAGEPKPLPGLSLPVFIDPSGKLTGLEEALRAYGKGKP
jgi:hypothetical protein